MDRRRNFRWHVQSIPNCYGSSTTAELIRWPKCILCWEISPKIFKQPESPWNQYTQNLHPESFSSLVVIILAPSYQYWSKELRIKEDMHLLTYAPSKVITKCGYKKQDHQHQSEGCILWSKNRSFPTKPLASHEWKLDHWGHLSATQLAILKFWVCRYKRGIFPQTKWACCCCSWGMKNKARAVLPA